jgi:hypothetical protein
MFVNHHLADAQLVSYLLILHALQVAHLEDLQCLPLLLLHFYSANSSLIIQLIVELDAAKFYAFLAFTRVAGYVKLSLFQDNLRKERDYERYVSDHEPLP